MFVSQFGIVQGGKRSVQKAIEDVREVFGVKYGDNRLIPHGWRYAAARLLAETDCTDAQIQAVSGHKTLAMVHKYRAQASQKKTSRLTQQ
ncbi:tyrosine-type recombinase/integrase [Ruegeria arenilitoris]|uniref:tyrosine-type recombinase/integrase n=1 Tax=Ruegeria arenilitoris TaxID=1173585 RepID=UPI00147D1DBE|nr:tyrosine-type recombinase/integrase [Ruegeria arenilitoris]